MHTVRTVSELRQHLSAARDGRQRIGLVPTMGNLHAGHLSLVARARQESDYVVTSIFINPMQFGPQEDLQAYPRTPIEDTALLTAAGCDCLFMPDPAELYPLGHADHTVIKVPGLSEPYCGRSRPGHFDGVATVVTKLFNLVQPDVACFGLKDYQQYLVVRRLVADLCFPLDIIGCETTREADGLAMSSRNTYLTPDQRAVAPRLYAVLQDLAGRIRAGERDYVALQAAGLEQLRSANLQPDYLAVAHADTLAPASPVDHRLVLLAAAWLGRTRLIDNLRLETA